MRSLSCRCLTNCICQCSQFLDQLRSEALIGILLFEENSHQAFAQDLNLHVREATRALTFIRNRPGCIEGELRALPGLAEHSSPQMHCGYQQ